MNFAQACALMAPSLTLLCSKYTNSPLSNKEVMDAALAGLEKAARRFDTRKGFRFSTYATWWMQQSIGQAILKRRKTLHLPSHAKRLQKRFRTN
jgi:DNA-directed RNA polymerase sigma subunit (sigma70/sigma32)